MAADRGERRLTAERRVPVGTAGRGAMAVMRPLLTALAYVAVGFVAIAVAVSFLGVATAGAVAFGLAVLAGGGVVHAVVLGRRVVAAQQLLVERLGQRIEALEARNETVGQELAQARGEARQIYEALAASGRAGGGLKEVVAEVRVLQKLVDQMRERQETERVRPAGRIPPPRPAPANDVAGAPPAYGSPILPSVLPPGAAERLAVERPMLAVVQDALSAGRIELVLQPIVTLPQRRRRFYECFSRIRDEKGELIAPDQYLDVAAETGLLPAIDNLLLFRCIQMTRRARQRAAGIAFFCNVSSASLADRDFVQDVTDFLEENRDLAQNIVLETPQSGLDFENEDLKRQVDRLAGLGTRFSLDNVTELPLDYARLAEWHIRFVKVPAERFADADPEGAWEGSLFQLRRMLGLHGIDLIVERIETDRQLVELLEFNIAYGQGYLFGEPKPTPEE